MPDIDILTGSRGWSANPHDYNLINSLSFRSDGSGELVLGYGQSILAVVRYRFEVSTPGLMRLTFVDAVSNELLFKGGQLGRQLVEAEGRVTRELKYVLRSGDFRGQMNMGSEHGPFTYHFRAAVTFDGPPYSEVTLLRFGHRPGVSDYTYYGYPVVDDSDSSSEAS